MGKMQTNPVAIRTQKAISDAFLCLVQESPYEQISVTDICRRADIVRKTFYNHFGSKDDVVTHLISDVFRQMEAKVDLQSMGVREILLAVFRFVMDNREALLLFYNRGLLRFAHKSIAAYITKDHILARLGKDEIDPRAHKYVAAQVPAVLMSVIETWIEGGFEESVEFLAELTEALLYKPNEQAH